MAQPENHATALGGQGGVLGVPDKLLSPPPFARPSLEKKYPGDAGQWSYNNSGSDQNTPDR